MKLSTWDSVKTKEKRSVFSFGHIITEFPNRVKRQRLFSHKLGKITFGSRDINSPRNEVIEKEKDSVDLDGYKYKNIGHTYVSNRIISKDEELNSFPIYAHGHPLGSSSAGEESCSRVGLICESGEGTDSICNSGKCIIGRLSYVRNKKWKYESINTYNSLPYIYYLNGDQEVSLHSVLRGKVVGFSESGPVTLSIDNPASKYSKILLPPKYYFDEKFFNGNLVKVDKRLDLIFNKPKNNIIGLEDNKEKFIGSFISSIYPDKSEGYLSLVLYDDNVRLEVKDGLTNLFSELSQEWQDECSLIIEEEYTYRNVRTYNNLEFISVIFDRINVLFNNIIQVTNSSFKRANLEYRKTSIARPIYSRLPGISEGYRSDPLFSENENPSQWLTSGSDEFLSKKKDQIASFYKNYLDPETCSPLVLDWLAQHVGLFGDLWDSRWDRKIKIALIENAFGWYEREKSITFPGGVEIKTLKGEILNKFPFTTSDVWTSDSSEDNSLKICTNEIHQQSFSNGEFISGFNFKLKNVNTTTNTLSLTPTNSIKIYDGKWNGLMEAKGSMLSLAFLSSVFNLKSHTYQELEIVETLNSNLIVKPKSGLRNAEVNAPILWPYKSDILQVGGTTDLKIGNFSNQIVAGVSRVTSTEDSKNVFFRVPYYYNRDGKSWDRVNYISRNWLPDNLNKRIQYAYLSADLWSVGDAFFELEAFNDNTYELPLTLTEDGNSYLTTEDGSPINYGL